MNRKQSPMMERTLLELFYRGREEELNNHYPRVLALLVSHFIGMDQGFAALQTIRQQTPRLKVWVDRELHNQYGGKAIVERIGTDDIIRGDQRWEGLKESFDYLFIPVLSFALLSRIACLDDNHHFVRLILWALCSGKKVGALSIGADPYHVIWREEGVNQGSNLLKQELRTLLQKIKEYGIRLMELDELSSWLSMKGPNTRQVLTAEDILSACAAQTKLIVISRNTIVTPLAADLAKEYGVKIDMR